MHVREVGAILVVFAVVSNSAAPAAKAGSTTVSKRVGGEEKATGRIFWNAFAEVLELAPFLPITINVPDVVSGVWGFFQGFLPGSEGTNPRDPAVVSPSPNKTNQEVRVTFDDVLDYIMFS